MAARDSSSGPFGPKQAERALAAWREHDAKSSLHPHDRDAIRSTDAARALVLELLTRPGAPRDLYNACARLGRLLGEAGASPSLVASTIDGAARALADVGATFDETRVPSARASAAEGYFAVAVETERLAARRTWEYPACAVRIAADTVAIAAGHPETDGEALADWCARVALGARKDGYKKAILGGSAAARSELGDALALVGITVTDRLETKGWLAFLKP